jgi:ribonuclease-3
VWLRKFQKRKHSSDPTLVTYLRKQLGFTPGSVEFYKQAFRHSSVAIKNKNGVKNSNERLEYLGDAVLDSIVAHHLYKKFPDLNEGELTKMKARVVSRRNLNALGEILDIPSQLDINLGKQSLHLSIIGNAFEALVGAIYLDKGYDVTQRIVLKMLNKNDLSKQVHDTVDFKSKLHEWCQKEKATLKFKVLAESQNSGNSYYEIAVFVNSKELGRGSGKSKKTAEQKAAEKACSHIE